MVVRKMKEKCKDAARMRREKERAEFVELSKLLPLPSSTTSQLDKASIIRLTSSYLRMRGAFPEGLGDNWGNNRQFARSSSIQQQLRQQAAEQDSAANHLTKVQQHVRELGSLILQTLDGFVFALHKDGKIMYISETASVHLGLPQIDLTGSSIFEYVHPSDHNDIYDIINLSDNEKAKLSADAASNNLSSEIGRSFCMRMKCILPKRNAGLVCSGYKAIHCNGYLKVRCKPSSNITASNSSNQESNWESYALVAVGHSLLPTASTEVKLTGNSFMFRASLDLKLYYIENSVTKSLDFEQIEMIGQSLYQFIHVNDLSVMEESHRTLLGKGQVVTRYYRLMKKGGGFVWIQSYATLINNPRNMPKPQHIVSICFVLGDNQDDSSCILNDHSKQNSYSASAASNDNLKKTILSSDESSKLCLFSRGSNSSKNQKREKYSSLKRGRKLKSNQTSARSIPLENHYNQNKVDYCSSHNNNPELQYQCHCYPNRISVNSTPIYSGMRRPSDDSCSIVSSIASTSVSSASSSSYQAAEFLNYTPNNDATYNQTAHDNHMPSASLNNNTYEVGNVQVELMEICTTVNNNQQYNEHQLSMHNQQTGQQLYEQIWLTPAELFEQRENHSDWYSMNHNRASLIMDQHNSSIEYQCNSNHFGTYKDTLDNNYQNSPHGLIHYQQIAVNNSYPMSGI